MKKIFAVGLILVVVFLTGCFRQSKEEKLGFNIGSMKLTSPVFENNQMIPARYTCDGDDMNPPLKISVIPRATKSLALIVDDPDAPNGDWVHWTLWNILPQVDEIDEGNIPNGAVEGLTDFGRNGWGGPCPPAGRHRYQFKLYALDNELHLANDATKADILTAIEGHVLEQSILIGLYQRQ